MNIYKRAIISLTRNLTKTIITFFLITVIGLLISSGFFIHAAIYQTENNLKSQTLPIATLTTDSDAIVQAMDEELHVADNFEFQNILSRELLDQIGALFHVREFDYAAYSHLFYSEQVRNADIREVYLDSGFSEEEIDDIFRNWPPVFFSEPRYEQLELFTIKGIRNADILDLRSESMQLIAGRVFTNQEVELGAKVAVIPKRFAEENSLFIGDVFVLKSFIPSYCGSLYEEIELKVVGIFEVLVEVMRGDLLTAINYRNFNRQIYTPISIAENSLSFRDIFLESATDDEILTAFGSDFFSFEIDPVAIEYQDILFVLHDFPYIYNFRSTVIEMLPEFWMVDDFYDEIVSISTMFQNMTSIADSMIVIASFICIALLSLTLVLFFYDRRYEINAYHAMGEKSKNIILQFLIETLLVLHVAFACFVISSYFISSELSLQLIYDEWLNWQPSDTTISLGRVNDLNLMGFGFRPTLEDVLDSHNLSFGLLKTLRIYISSLIIVIVTTLIAVTFVLKKYVR